MRPSRILGYGDDDEGYFLSAKQTKRELIVCQGNEKSYAEHET